MFRQCLTTSVPMSRLMVTMSASGYGMLQNPGQFKVNSEGTIKIDKADITSVKWMNVPRAYQLEFRIKDGMCYKFIAFREQDVSTLTSFMRKSMGILLDEKRLSVSGHNWGGVDIDDVSQTQLQGNTDVLLEFHVDDTTGANEKDPLMDMSFHVPTSNIQFIGNENHNSA